MKVKYILFWVFSVLLITSADCYGSDLSVEGKVRKVDGSAIRGGTVIIYEYITKLGNPDVQIHAVISTDKDGRFKTSIQYLGGDLDIQLIKDRCDWKATSQIIVSSEIEKKLHIQLNARVHKCEK